MQLNIAMAGFPCVPVNYNNYSNEFIQMSTGWQKKKEMHNQLGVRDAIILTCSQISDRRWYNLCWCY